MLDVEWEHGEEGWTISSGQEVIDLSAENLNIRKDLQGDVAEEIKDRLVDNVKQNGLTREIVDELLNLMD